MGLFSKKSKEQPPYYHPFEEVIAELLKNEGYNFKYNSDFHVFELIIAGRNCHFRTIVFYNDVQEAVAFRSYFPLDIRDEYKLRVAEFITRVNYRLFVGSIKLDMEDGTCYMDTLHLLQQSVLDQRTFSRLLGTNCSVTDDCFLYLLNVNTGNDEPLLAAMKMLGDS